MAEIYPLFPKGKEPAAASPALDGAGLNELLQAAHRMGQRAAAPMAKPGVGQPRKPLTPIWAKDMKPRLTAGGTLVKGLLDEGAMSVVYAPSNAGKSFFVLDLAFHIATGRDWRDRKIKKPGCVVYIAAEGGYGFINRVVALKLHHNLPGDEDVPLAVLPCPVDLLDPEADTPRVVELVRQVERDTGQPVVMVVIDTLSRAIAGGDENGPKDMTAFVANVDTIRHATPHCLIVHHAGKDVAKGARGHSSLRAATDTEIELVPTGEGKACVATVTKQRDLEGGDVFYFTLESVDLGRDEDGTAVTSAVVAHLDGAAAGKKPDRLTDTECQAKRFLADLIAAEGEPLAGNLVPKGLRGVPEERWQEECESRGLSKAPKPASRDKAFQRAFGTLQEKQLVACRDGTVWLTRPEDEKTG